MDLEYHRKLPPELLVEMHKCLPLANQIYVLVNVSKTFVLNNSTRMRRNIQRTKMSLHKYIGTLVGEERKNDRHEELWIYNKNIEWKPELDALFRCGNWLTSAREFRMGWSSYIVGIPKNFVEELILHLANSSSPQMTLDRVKMNFGTEELPIPTFIKPLLNTKNQQWIGLRFLFESFQLETNNGQVLHIYDGELDLYQYRHGYTLYLFVKNKMDGKNWFQIRIDLNSSKESIQYLEFSKWIVQSSSFDDIANFVNENGIWKCNNDKIKQNGNNILEVATNIYWNHKLDLFLRRGAGFSQFRHFKIKERYFLNDQPKFYADFLINSMANTKHPEDFLESFELNLKKCRCLSINQISEICHKGISEGDGKFINFVGNKLQIISTKVAQLNNKLEFTLANIPTNGAYLFDVEVQFVREGSKFVRGIKIQKRKIGDGIVELKYEDQIGQGKKRKATNDNDGEGEDEPTCSAKLMKQ